MKRQQHNLANSSVAGRTIYRLTKPKAKNHFLYNECAEDSWIIWEYTIETKSGAIKNRSIFIAKDIPHVIRSRNGWLVEKVDEPLEETARI